MQGTEKISWTNWAFVDRRVDVYAQQAVEDLLDNGLGEFDELRQGGDDLFFGEARQDGDKEPNVGQALGVEFADVVDETGGGRGFLGEDVNDAQDEGLGAAGEFFDEFEKFIAGHAHAFDGRFKALEDDALDFGYGADVDLGERVDEGVVDWHEVQVEVETGLD